MSDIELSLEDRIAQLEAEAARALAEAEAKKAEVEKLKADARQGVIEQIKAQIKLHGLEVSDFFPQAVTEKKTRAKRGQSTQSRKPKGPAKYRNAIDPNQTWSGKGRKPEWVNTYLANGGDLENLRIKEGE